MKHKTVSNYFAKFWNILQNKYLLRPWIYLAKHLRIRHIARIVIIFILLIEFGLLPQIVKRGFYCDDRSIAKKFNGETISTKTLFISAVAPFFLIWLAEALCYSPEDAKALDFKKNTKFNISFHETFYWFKKYLKGILIKLVIVDTVKIFLGGLRPHFLDTCQPDAWLNCTTNEYITDYECTNTMDNHYFVRDASKSFPSGHASISVFEAVFIIWYLQIRVPKLKSNFFVPFLQMLVMIWAVLCSTSRITDNRHHWWDVMAGVCVGIVAAVLTCIYACHNFDRSARTYKESFSSSASSGKESAMSNHKLIPTIGIVKEEINLNNVSVS